MKSGNPIKHFVFAFLIALVFYAIAYNAIEHRRVRKGPWQVTFTRSPGAVPMIIVDQAALGITNVQIVFPGESGDSERKLLFNQPRPVPYDVPFGQCIFMDTTFLPGTVTFRLFGHEIELLPRVLILDHEEHRWLSNEVIPLRRTPNVAPAKPQARRAAADLNASGTTGESTNL